jgi:hypothetical protein
MKLIINMQRSESQWVASIMDITDSECHVCLWAGASSDKAALQVAVDAEMAKLELGMYRIWLTNHNYFLDFTTDSYDEAIAKAKSVGFEVGVYRGKTLVAAYSPIGGLKTF